MPDDAQKDYQMRFWEKGICLAVFLLWASPAHAVSQRGAVDEGNRSYSSGDYENAVKKYEEALIRDPESDIVNFNLGTALYKKERYEEAVGHLQKTLLSEDERLKEKAFYNLGNALYRSGIVKEKEDPSAAVSSLRDALKQYEQALSLDQKDENALYNYEFVKKELERLMEKQRQKNQQPQESPSSKKDEGESRDSQKPEGESPQEKSSQPQEEESQGTKRDEAQEPSSTPQQLSDGGEETSGEPRESQTGDRQELTPSEAQMLLEGYQQAEEPKGLLNVFQGKMDSSPVLKDW